jgi:menaquinone-dependent protoporphyrinogen oxidase
MKNRIGLIYASVDGQTAKISEEIRSDFYKAGREIELYNIEDFDKNVEEFDTLIIGSSIRYGVHNEAIIDFIEKNTEKLEAIKSIFFSVNLVARKPEKNEATTNPYVVKFFEKIKWRPLKVAVFAGMLDYKKYGFWDRKMIQLIMWITKGPTNSDAKIEYTDWNKVHEFSQELISLN